MHENFFMTKWWFYLNSVPFLCFHTLHTDIQILIVMIVNADNTCDECALDALQHFSLAKENH